MFSKSPAVRTVWLAKMGTAPRKRKAAEGSHNGAITPA
jgi:hypothetical protein